MNYQGASTTALKKECESVAVSGKRTEIPATIASTISKGPDADMAGVSLEKIGLTNGVLPPIGGNYHHSRESTAFGPSLKIPNYLRCPIMLEVYHFLNSRSHDFLFLLIYKPRFQMLGCQSHF